MSIITKGVRPKVEKRNPVRKTSDVLIRRDLELSFSQNVKIKIKKAAADKPPQKKDILPAKMINSLFEETSKRKEDMLHKAREKV